VLKNKVQWLDLAFCSCHIGWIVIGKDVIGVHYEIIVKYSNPRLMSSSPNYSWFMQYMKSDNEESAITQLPLGMNSSYTSGKLIYCVFVVHPSIIFTYPITKFCL
jgi:hypothetical protein